MLPLLAALALPVVAGPSTILDVGARAEFRLRQPGDPDVATAALEARSLDLDATAMVGMRFRWRRTRVQVDYTPRLTLRNFNEDSQRDVFHAGFVALEWNSRRVGLVLSERAGYGDRTLSTVANSDSSLQASGGFVALQTVPSTFTVTYMLSDSILDALLRITRRSALLLEVAYRIEGGVDAESRRTVPLAQGPRGAVAWRYDLNRRDTLATRADGTVTDTEASASLTKVRATVVSGREVWNRQWGRDTQTELAAGVVWAETSVVNQSAKAYPLASAFLSQTLYRYSPRERLDVRGSVDSSVVIDRLLGFADHRFQASARADWLLGSTTIYGNALHSQSLPPYQITAVRLTAFDAAIRQEVERDRLSFELGFRTFQQKFLNSAGVPSFEFTGLQWAVFAAMIVSSKPARL